MKQKYTFFLGCASVSFSFCRILCKITFFTIIDAVHSRVFRNFVAKYT